MVPTIRYSVVKNVVRYFLDMVKQPTNKPLSEEDQE